jgi:glycosyltransferase involved in cell wall biosynthesis
VVYANPCRFLQAPAALRRLSVPTVYYCDEPRRLFYDPGAAGSVKSATRPIYAALRRRERSLDRSAARCASTLLTNSRYTADRLQRAYGRQATVLRPAVNPFFTPSPTVSDPTHVLSVGTLLPTKGHDLAITGLATSRLSLPLVVVAPRDEPVEAERLRRLAATHAVELHIRLGVSDDELRQLYRSALVTLYLARLEPLGLASLESQACGTPVIVAAEGGLPETVIPGRTGWVTPREPAAVADRLNQVTGPVRFQAGAAAVEHLRGWRPECRAASLAELLAGQADRRRSLVPAHGSYPDVPKDLP